jgi:hypothetical protein
LNNLQIYKKTWCLVTLVPGWDGQFLWQYRARHRFLEEQAKFGPLHHHHSFNLAAGRGPVSRMYAHVLSTSPSADLLMSDKLIR